MASEPIYQRIKRELLDGIAHGVYPPGGRLPSENELVARLGCSRMTVNRALNELTRDGVLTRVQGSGTYVSDRRDREHVSFLEVRDIAKEIAAQGAAHDAEVLDLAAIAAPKDVAAALDFDAGAEVYYSHILHRADGVAIQLEERFVSPAFAPEYLQQDFTAITPFDYLWACGPITEVEHIVEAMSPDAETIDLLALSPEESVLVLRRRTWVGAAPVMTGKFLHPGNRFSLAGKFSYAGA